MAETEPFETVVEKIDNPDVRCCAWCGYSASITLAKNQARSLAIEECAEIAEMAQQQCLRKATHFAEKDGEGSYMAIAYKRRADEAEIISNAILALKSSPGSEVR